MADEQAIHAATLIRLQVTHNALEDAAPTIANIVRDLPDVARRLERAGETGVAEHVSEMHDKLDELLPLIRAALDIARGARTDVPPGLRGSLAPDPAMLTRSLEIPTAAP